MRARDDDVGDHEIEVVRAFQDLEGDQVIVDKPNLVPGGPQRLAAA
jgi:hypothetical protein